MSDEDEVVEEAGAPAWMATFGDLMSLLLTFFVLLMSFASMDVRRFAAVTGSVRDAFGVQNVHPGQIESLSDSIVTFSDREATPYVAVIDSPMDARRQERQRVQSRVQAMLRSQRLERIVEVEETPRGVVVRVPGQLLFEAGASELSLESQIFLREMSEVIKEFPDQVAVEGHSDPSPVGSSKFRSNFELSAARAVAALDYLVTVGGVDPKRLRATGYGATRPIETDPLDGNTDASKHRRVEFVFLRTEPSVGEKSGTEPAATEGG